TDKPIAGIDAKARTILLDGQGGYDIRASNRYFVQNILALLDAPGECQISTKTLYCTPRADAKGIVAATAQHLITIRSDAAPVRNLHFRGLDLAAARDDLVRIAGAEDCSIRSCLLENAGQRGVLVRGASRRITLYGNHIREHGLHGVELQGLPPGRPDANRDHVVENNHIHHCGRLVGHGYGVRIQQSGHNRVAHNHIHHMPRYATTIKGTRYQVLRTQVKGVTFANRHDFLHSRNNLLAYNHIHHVNLDSQDTGAMESWGPGRDNVYDHNLIHDVGNTRFNLQSGLYLDDATDHFTVTNNIIYGVIGAGSDQPIYAKGIGNRIDNNILIVGSTNARAISSFFMADERCDHHTYTRNLIVFEGKVVKQGAFGHGIGAIHDRGTTRRWNVTVPADGDYRLWLRYAALNKKYGNDNMAGRFTMQADGGKPVTLGNLPDTGGWGVQKWSTCATLPLTKGDRTLTWTNVKGGGINWDAFVLTTDPAWKPTGTDLQPPAKGRALVVVQTELFIDDKAPADPRTAWHFQNWSDDRIEASDKNLFWKPGGPILIRQHRKLLTLEDWQKRFDKNSIVADPQFVDLAGRDFRLKPTSPALKLGFEPIDTSRIGLKDDFPKRFPR
ncbi:right-handed parallel beta-helix repeat-containing protein, partial [bacterium]|nr:right-handed parallel beta-helix repeat-containing protein [bacterium]